MEATNVASADVEASKNESVTSETSRGELMGRFFVPEAMLKHARVGIFHYRN